MEKSKPVPIRFSMEELATIKEFMKKYEMKSLNDVVRFGVAFFIGMLAGFEKLRLAFGFDKLFSNIRKPISAKSR